MAVEVKLPELGENVESGTVVKVLVSEGDEVQRDQSIIELETDKAVLEVPSDTRGIVKRVLVREGEKILVGQNILILDAAEEKPAAKSEVKQKDAPTGGEPRKAETPEKPPTPGKEGREEEVRGLQETPPPRLKEERKLVPGAPSVRRFAREIGVEIVEVPGTGLGGRISIEDVKRYSKQLHTRRAVSRELLSGLQREPLPDFSRWGEVERKPMSSVREKTALHLSFAWATIPHVTQFDRADVTELENLRKQFSAQAEEAGGKLTITAILLKIVAAGLKIFPQFNASIDIEKKEIIEKHYYNIGVAVDTDRGLLVPVIRRAESKNIIQLSVELGELGKKARNKRLTLEEMQGGNFTISNLGGIGGTAFTPVVNSPEVAILGVSRSRMEQVFLGGKFEPRSILPLSLSYDHRLIDGADAARFLRWVAEAIEEPFKIALEG